MFPLATLATLTAFTCANDGCWCPPPRMIVICPPVIYSPPPVWIECPPAMMKTAPVKPTKPDEPKAEEKKPVPKVEKKPETKAEIKPEIKPVSDVTPKAPDILPKTVTPPEAPKPAPKIELELPMLPPSKPMETIIPKPTDLPSLPPVTPSGGAPKAPDKLSPVSYRAGYRPRVNVVTFPSMGDSTEVTVFNLSASRMTVLVSGRELTIPAKSRQAVTVSGDVTWSVPGGEAKRIDLKSGQAEIYWSGE